MSYLAVLARQAVRVVEADLDAHLLTRAGLLCVGDATLSESALCVTATSLWTVTMRVEENVN